MADLFSSSILGGRPVPLEPVQETQDVTVPVASAAPADFLSSIFAGRPVPIEDAAPVTPGATSVAPQDPAKIALMNKIRASKVEDLAEDDTFDPVGFIAQNEDLANDPDVKKKLIDVARARHEKPFSFGKFLFDLPSAAKDAVVGFTKGGIKAFERAATVADPSSGPLSRLEALGELASATETAAVQDADLGRRAARNIFSSAPKTDEDFEKRLFGDAEFRKQIAATAAGQGAAGEKYFGTDVAEQLGKYGLKVNPEDVQQMSVATDLLNFLPAGAALRNAGKAFRITEAGVQLVDNAGKVLADVAPRGSRTFKVIETFNKIADKIPDSIGSAVEKTGQAINGISKQAEKVPATLAGAVTGGIPGAVVGAAAHLVLPKIGTKVGSKLIEAGKVIRGDIPAGPLFSNAGKIFNNPATRGAAAGLGLSLPKDVAEILASKGSVAGKIGDIALASAPAGLATANIAAADTEKEKAQAIAGQAGVGALFGAGAEGLQRVAPYFDIAHQAVGGTPVDKPVASSGYGTDAALDAAHETAMKGLAPLVQNRLNGLRELFRPKGAEIYVLPSDNFGSAVADFYRQQAEQRGVTIDAGTLKAIAEKAAQDGGQKGVFVENFNLNGQKKKVVFLNKDGSAAGHETGHLFDSLFSPEDRSSLRDAAYKAYSPEEQMALKKDYDEAFRRADPNFPGLTQGQLLDEIVAETISAAISGLPIEKLGTPKPVARAIYQKLGDLLNVNAGKTDTLGLRKDIGLTSLAETLVRAKAVDDIPVVGPVANVDFSKVNIGAKPQPVPPVQPVTPAQPVSPGTPVPPGQVPIQPAAAGPLDPNIRVTRDQQNQFRGREEIPAVDTGLQDAAKHIDANPGKYTPKQKSTFVKLGAALTQGGVTPGPLEVTYNSIKTDKFKAGRAVRKGEQDAGYAKERSGAVPSSVRQQVQKVIVPNRVEVRGGEVILHAFSLDKVIENVDHIIPDAVSKGAGKDIPYTLDNGKLTPESAQQLVKDVQDYTRNQANGYAGNGKPVVVPETYFGAIPKQNSSFTPVLIPDERAQFVNVLLAGNYGAGAPPKTNRKSVRPVPANVSARELATANNRPVLPAAASKPGKNFFDAYGVEIAEFNPLRDKLFRKGVDIDNLGASNEVLKLSEIEDVKPRNDLDFSRPSTDLIRAGFMPDPQRPVRKTDDEIAAVANWYAHDNGIEYKPFEGYAKLPEDLGKKIADWFDTAKHEPNSPAVQESYRSLVDETKKQYEAMKAAGYKIEAWTGKGEPYSSSADMVNDVTKNKHLYFLPTDQSTFGSAGKDSSGNPMLEQSGLRSAPNDRPLLNNDLFRAVHDFFGHAKQGYEFGPRGEYNAFLAHSSMFTPDAIPALAAETLAQNAWVNFGKHLRREDGTIPVRGDKDFVPLNERPFADQKNTVVPGNLLAEAFPKQEKTAAEQRAAVKGSFAPEKPVIVGSVEDDGTIQMKLGKGVSHDTAFPSGWNTDLAWRFRPDTGELFWWNGKPDVKTQDLVKEHLRSKNYEVRKSSVIDGENIATDRAHGHFAPDMSLRSEELQKELHAKGYNFHFDEASKKDGGVIRVTKGMGNEIGRIQFDIDGGVGTIYDVTVDKKHRGQGIGELLYRKVGNYLSEQGIQEVHGAIYGSNAFGARNKVFGKPSSVEGDAGKLPKNYVDADRPSISVTHEIPPGAKFVPEMSPGKKKAIEDAIANKDTHWQYTVQPPQEYKGAKIPGFVQVDAIENGKNTVSSNPADLRALGSDLPEVPDWIPMGQYSLAELNKLIEDGPRDAKGSFAPADKLDSPKFKAWFGDSKVVDKDGQPLKMFHGTNDSSIEAFKPGGVTGLIWTTKSSKMAEGYAMSSTLPNGDTPAQVYPVYVKAENLFDVKKLGYRVGELASEWVSQQGFVLDEPYWKERLKRYEGSTTKDKFVSAVSDGKWEAIEVPEFLDFLKERGFDGVVTNENRAYNVGVFDPAQIKSAIANNGDYDPNNPKISFLPFAAKTKLPDSVKEDSLNLVHYGTAGLSEIDPKRFGRSGLVSRSELSGKPRSYFYEAGKVNKDDPVVGRGSLYDATVSGDRIYDGDKDALGYADMINREKADAMLQKEGYVGISRTAGAGKSKYRQVELFEPVPVESLIRPAEKKPSQDVPIRAKK